MDSKILKIPLTWNVEHIVLAYEKPLAVFFETCMSLQDASDEGRVGRGSSLHKPGRG